MLGHYLYLQIVLSQLEYVGVIMDSTYMLLAVLQMMRLLGMKLVLVEDIKSLVDPDL